jgi:hypothetical protein
VLLLALLPQSSLAAQDGTPSGATAPSGIVAGATRVFQATGPRLLGSTYLQVTAFVMVDAAVAERSMDVGISGALAAVSLSTPARPVSVDPIGDEAEAYLATMASDGTEFPVGFVFWRDDRVLYAGFSLAVGGDPLADLFALARTITGRPYVETLVTEPATPGGMWSGGVWNLLPTLADVPEGFVFVSDTAQQLQ